MTENKKRILIIIITAIIILIAVLIILFLIASFFTNQISGNKTTVGFISRSTTNDSVDDNSATSVEDETETIEEVGAYNDSYEIRVFVNSNWSRISTTAPTDYEKDEQGNYVYEGYTVYSDNGTFIKYIIFNENYTSKVVGGLSVGATYDEVVETLGEPTFYDESLGVYGYKLSTVYAFFYDDKIVVYPNMDVTNNDLETLIFRYIQGNYNGSQTNFVVELRTNYDDFLAESDGEDIILTSLNRGIKIRLNGTAEETLITIYNGYSQGSLISENLGNLENIVDNRNEDLVYIAEVERVLAE